MHINIDRAMMQSQTTNDYRYNPSVWDVDQKSRNFRIMSKSDFRKNYQYSNAK